MPGRPVGSYAQSKLLKVFVIPSGMEGFMECLTLLSLLIAFFGIYYAALIISCIWGRPA